MTLTRILRAFRFPLAAGLAVATVSVSYPGGVSAAVDDIYCYGEASADIEASTQREADLAVQSRTVTDRLTYKQGVCQEVIAGQLLLADAATRFLDVTRSDVQAMSFVRGRFEGSTDHERFAANVVTHVDTLLVNAGNRAEVVGRLDREFRQLFGHPRHE